MHFLKNNLIQKIVCDIKIQLTEIFCSLQFLAFFIITIALLVLLSISFDTISTIVYFHLKLIKYCLFFDIILFIAYVSLLMQTDLRIVCILLICFRFVRKLVAFWLLPD